MSLRMLLGRSGSGKTTYCIENIQEKLRESPAGSPIILLVPDQMTFQMEYRLTHTSELQGMSRVQVLSFSRLALYVFKEVGGLTRQHISSVGFNMLLRKIVEHNKDQLRIYQKAAEQQGFYDELDHMITEFKRYRLAPEDLRSETLASSDETGTELTDKLHDLGLIYDDVQQAMTGHYMDNEDNMALLAESVPHSERLAAAEVWVDGFYTFTPQELLVIKALLGQVRRLSVSLTLDPANRTDAFFSSPVLTEQQLQQAAEEVGVLQEPDVCFEDIYRYNRQAMLAHLQHYYEKQPPVTHDGTNGVTLAQAIHRRSEVEGTARDIIRLVRDKGKRYQDIALIIGNQTVYNDLIETIFADYDIPVFLDRPRTMSHHPLLELIRASLDVIRQNWRY